MIGIELSVLAEKLNYSIEELQEHLFKLGTIISETLIRSTKKVFSCSLTFKIPWIPGLRFLNSLKLTLLNRLFSMRDNHLTKCVKNFVMSCERVQEIIQHLNTKLPQTLWHQHPTFPFSHVDGTEEDIRAFYLDYFSQSYDFLDWPFLSISEESLTHLIQLFWTPNKFHPASVAYGKSNIPWLSI